MEVIYNWLLHNTGNEGNYLTILNVQPRREGDSEELMVMARNKNFKTVNLFITAISSSNEAKPVEGRTVENEYRFDNPDQIITYLADGQESNLVTDTDEPTLYLYVLKPVNGSGDITFPPQQ